jgi:hypothetical protein
MSPAAKVILRARLVNQGAQMKAGIAQPPLDAAAAVAQRGFSDVRFAPAGFGRSTVDLVVTAFQVHPSFLCVNVACARRCLPCDAMDRGTAR